MCCLSRMHNEQKKDESSKAGKRKCDDMLWLAGSAVGLAVPVLGLPLAQIAAGWQGLQVALIWEVIAVVAGMQAIEGAKHCMFKLKLQQH